MGFRENILLVLIDESGCPGFKLTKGSTPYFVIGMVIFENFLQAEITSKTIQELRQLLKIKPEFKFSKTRPEVKDKFFDSICQHDFEIRALVVDKSRIYSSKLRNDTDAFYNYFLKSLMQNDSNILQNASIKIDGNGDKEFKKALSAYLRQSIGQNKIKKFKFVDSRNDNLIQLADMIVSAIARSYNKNRIDGNRWLNVLRKNGKIKNIWEFK
jgi:hypothetical protein